jgi:hypothetical protein
LIEEIENGLHPVATVRLVEYLIDVAERKKAQVIFTTHSNDAIRILPTKAVWVATQDRIFQGKLDVRSLRAITGQIETKAIVFVEDRFAKTWVEAILRQTLDFPIDHVQVHAMSGDGTAVAMNKYHNENPAIQTPSICIIDGDSRKSESESDRVYRLPGGAPELKVGTRLEGNYRSQCIRAMKILTKCLKPANPLGDKIGIRIYCSHKLVSSWAWCRRQQ